MRSLPGLPSRLQKIASLLFLGLMMIPASGRGFAQAPAKQADGGQQTTPEGQSPLADATEKDENAVYRHSAVVKKMGQMLGMSPETASTTFEVFNFVVLAGALGFAALKILPKTFRDRESALQKELTDARTATEESRVRLNSVEERLSKLDDQIAEMKAQSEKDAAAEEQRFRAAAEEEKAKILAAADQEIASATQQGQRQLQQYAASLAVEQAARRLVITAETDRLLVQNFAQRLGEGGKGGEN